MKIGYILPSTWHMFEWCSSSVSNHVYKIIKRTKMCKFPKWKREIDKERLLEIQSKITHLARL